MRGNFARGCATAAARIATWRSRGCASATPRSSSSCRIASAARSRRVEIQEAQLAELEAELASEVAALDATPNAGSFALEARPLRPRKGDLAIDPVTLVWTPWALGPDGVATPLFDR